MGFLKRKFIGLCLIASCTFSAAAAPLFPDVPDNHWAKDAVAALAAKGLVEGYPDGTFKGDRSASRWETAMIVARLLSKMEQAHSTFATKAELDELRKLANALREELDALGVRVDNLEENVSLLDKRVTELERITFYGNVETRVSFHSFNNDGANLSDPTDALINFDNAVGSSIGAGGVIPTGPAAGINFNPFAFGTFTSTNLDKGTPLINGTGFTALARLGLNIKVTDDIDARAEFTAFSSQGNALTDLYYGVSAPYLNNGFQANSTVSNGAGVQGINNQPFTRMNLDHFWVHHKPSNVRIRVGTISDIKFDNSVYQKQYNPGAFAPAFLDSYGFQVTGKQDLDRDENVSWEVMGTRLPDRNAGIAGNGYNNHAFGGNFAYNWNKEKGQVKINFLRAANEASGGAALQTGLLTAANITSVTPWVNPGGYFQNQINGPLAGFNQAAGIGSTSDIRPVPNPTPLLNDGVIGIPGSANFGNLGPQSQNTWGLSARYNWDDNKFKPYVRGEFAHSEYRPNKNSPVNADGNAWRVQVGAQFFDESLAVDAEYLSVDPDFDPFVLQMPRIGGIQFNAYRFGENFFNQRGDLYNLHDTADLPHNREGFRGKLKWDFADEGSVGFRFGFLDQKDPSLQDVRVSTGSIGLGIPVGTVLGFSPGFTEPVFGGFSPFTFTAAPGTGIGVGAFNTVANPLEVPKGSVDQYAADAKYRWVLEESTDENNYWSRGVTLSGGFNYTNFKRNSNLRALLPGPNGIAGESVNNVDLSYMSWGINVDYDVTPKFTVNAGYSEFNLSGHYDPFGIYSAFAVANNNTTFDNLDVTQSQPMVGFEYQVTDSMAWDLQAMFLSTKDNVSSNVFSTPVNPGFNQTFTPQRSIHPFSYDGIMVNSSFNFSF